MQSKARLDANRRHHEKLTELGVVKLTTRLRPHALAALEALEADGTTRQAAIEKALIEAAARLRHGA